MDRISVKSTISGLVVGTLILCANFQFGLQTGWVSMMSMPAALLGFAWFKTVRSGLTPQENVYIQSVAVAVGTGPLSFGFVGAIPAIELLLSDEEGRSVLSVGNLILWSFGIAFMGIFLAILLRNIILCDKRMKFPSGAAAAALIGVLHNKPVIQEEDWSDEEYDEEDLRQSRSHGIDPERYVDDASSEPDELDEPVSRAGRSSRHSSRPDTSMILNSSDGRNRTYKKNIIVLATMFTISAIYTILSKVLWFLRAIPIFGHRAATYMWQFEFSPAYVGQGIIMGLPTTAAMMLGAILGWAILVPLSDKMNWAPGPIDDWQNGAQGWIMWVSLAIMVGDTGVSFFILTSNAFIDLVHKTMPLLTNNFRFGRLGDYPKPNSPNGAEDEEDGNEESVLSRTYPRENSTNIRPGSVNAMCYSKTPSNHVPALIGLVASGLVCIVCVKILFGDVPILALTIAVIFSPFLSLLGVRALGETDLNPVSSISKLTQFVFGVMMHSKPNAVLLNIVAGAITEAGAQQAGDLMQDFKTGGILGALMSNQSIGMAIGTMWSVLASGFVYKLYTSHFEIPGTEFRIPTAYIWADCARLMTGEGLPPKAAEFSLIFGLIFVILAIVKHSYQHKKWAKWIPSGVAVGIGMYNVPSFTIARFIGGLVAYLYERRYPNPADKVYLVILSSGLILGEGLMSVVYLVATL